MQAFEGTPDDSMRTPWSNKLQMNEYGKNFHSTPATEWNWEVVATIYHPGSFFRVFMKLNDFPEVMKIIKFQIVT